MWYKLDGDIPVPVIVNKISKNNNRHNITTLEIKDNINVRVSTTFLGLDHSYSKKAAPVLFETMVFIDECKIKLDPEEFLGRKEIQVRYETIQGARKGHKKIVEHVKDELMKKELGDVEINNNRLSL